MAANCRRLMPFWSSRWIPGVCRLHQSAGAVRMYSSFGAPRPAVCKLAVPSHLTATRRQRCTKTVDPRDITTTASASGPIPEQRSAFSRFWRWLHDIEDEQIIDQEEKQQREALLHRIQNMYFAKPPVNPDLDFYKEVFQALVKYNDRVGVETLWNFMTEMNVEPDAELVAVVEPFLEKARRNVWFE